MHGIDVVAPGSGGLGAVVGDEFFEGWVSEQDRDTAGGVAAPLGDDVLRDASRGEPGNVVVGIANGFDFDAVGGLAQVLEIGGDQGADLDDSVEGFWVAPSDVDVHGVGLRFAEGCAGWWTGAG